MVHCDPPLDRVPTTTCVVQKEKTQTRITFNNLSSSLTVNDLYKFVQLQLDEDHPFELTLVREGDSSNNGHQNAASVKGGFLSPIKVRSVISVFGFSIATWRVVFLYLYSPCAVHDWNGME